MGEGEKGKGSDREEAQKEEEGLGMGKRWQGVKGWEMRKGLCKEKWERFLKWKSGQDASTGL